MTWWICHVSVLFWKIKNPLQARYFDKSNRVCYIHIACVLLSLLVPLIPILVTIGNNLDDNLIGTAGFTITRFPPLLCTSIDPNTTFYAFVLPIILMVDIGLTLLLLLVWIVHKVYIYCSIKYSTLAQSVYTSMLICKHTHYIHACSSTYDAYTCMTAICWFKCKSKSSPIKDWHSRKEIISDHHLLCHSSCDGSNNIHLIFSYSTSFHSRTA